MSRTPAPTLTCAQCGFVNEAERVYCHNCGTKLDRSLLPKEAPRKAESLDATRRRVRQMTNPGGGILPHLKTAVNILIYAAIVAALLLIALPPEGVPTPKVELSERLVSSDMLEAMESPQPRQLVFNESDVNAHFRGLKSKTGGWIPGLQFKRSFVQFHPGVVRISVEQTLWNYPLFTSIDYRLSVIDGQFIAEQNGGRYGRLAIHPALMTYASAAFDKLWGALKREHDQMKRMQSVTVQKGRVILVTKPGGRP